MIGLRTSHCAAHGNSWFMAVVNVLSESAAREAGSRESTLGGGVRHVRCWRSCRPSAQQGQGIQLHFGLSASFKFKKMVD